LGRFPMRCRKNMQTRVGSRHLFPAQLLLLTACPYKVGPGLYTRETHKVIILLLSCNRQPQALNNETSPSILKNIRQPQLLFRTYANPHTRRKIPTVASPPVLNHLPSPWSVASSHHRWACSGCCNATKNSPRCTRRRWAGHLTS